MPAAEPRQAARPQTRVRTARVRQSRRLTPEMVRLVFDGPDLVDLPVGACADHYVKLVFPPAGAPYSTAAEFAEMRDSLSAEHRPALRTYTVRAYDETTGELALDFVVHGDEGVAGPWAAAARPGDEVMLLGPGEAIPRPRRRLALADRRRERLACRRRCTRAPPGGVPVHVFVEVAGAVEEQPLESPADMHLTWVHRDAGDGTRGVALVETVRRAALPPGQVHAFLHGEAGFVKELRHHLRFERDVPRESLSVSGYWRLGRDDERWRAEKAAWKSEVEADEQRNAS